MNMFTKPILIAIQFLLQTFIALFLFSPLAKGGVYKGQGGTFNLGTFGGQLPMAVKVIRVTNTVAVPVPVPFPVPKHIPFPVSVPKPFPYAVPQPIPVEVTKPLVIQQAVPVGIPKPYALPHMFDFRLNSGMSAPSEQLTVPQYHHGQVNDYQAYISYENGNGGSIGYGNGNGGSIGYGNGNGGSIGYGNGNGGSISYGNGNGESVGYGNGDGGNVGYGNGNAGSTDYSSTNTEYSQMGYSQEQSFTNQQGYSAVDQGFGGYSSQSGDGFGYQTSPQGGYSPSGQGYMEQGYSQGPTGYSQATGYGVMLGQNFESTNSVDDQGSARAHGSY